MHQATRPAGFSRRLGALIYDTLLILAVWFVTLFILVAIRNDAVTGPTIQSILFLELFTFFAYFWRSRGQTLGMLAWHLQLPDATPRVIVLMAAAAPGFNAYLFAAMYNRGQDSAASSVLLSTLLSVFTISGWLILL